MICFACIFQGELVILGGAFEVEGNVNPAGDSLPSLHPSHFDGDTQRNLNLMHTLLHLDFHV